MLASSPAAAGSTPAGLYIAPLRPLPAVSPAGEALHNKTLCKLARGNDEPHAANAATALKMAHGPRPVEVAALRQLRRLHTCHLPESPSGFRRSLQCPAAPAKLLLLSFIVIAPSLLRHQARVAVSSGHCGHVPTGIKQMTDNQQQAQSLPPAPRGLLKPSTKGAFY